jgi:superfamily II DNA or RNA helicase
MANARQETQTTVRYAPGMRVLIRDAEWWVRRVDPTTNNNYALSVSGVSELVRGHEAVFLTAAENIEILDPADTNLVGDDSPAFLRTRLHLESQLRSTPPTGPELCIGQKGAMDTLPFQLIPAWKALQQSRPRFLIADTVGLGKTLEAGILVSELIRRGRGKRILVVTVKSVLVQFQKEWWARFTIPLMRLDSQNLQRVRNRLPTNQNPFYYYDRSIISIDTLKQDNEFRGHLERAYWDIIVIDEAHNVAKRAGHSQRNRLATLLSSRSDALFLLTATPHDGRKASFASLINMLDATAIADPDNYTKEDIKGLYIRRFRKDVAKELGTLVKERVIEPVRSTASLKEQEVFHALDKLVLTGENILIEGAKESKKGKGGHQLFRTTLLKGFLSSPGACLETLDQRIEKTEKGLIKSNDKDLKALQDLREKVAAIDRVDFSKFSKLVEYLKDWKPAKNDRLVIFTERIRTLHYLEEHLPKELGLEEDEFEILHGTMPDTEQTDLVERFGQENNKLRLLLATDVASEGINLHFTCHRLIHFDLPWSLMTFSQRNGRIDRIRQKEQPQIAYLLTCDPKTPRTDERILQLLVQKDEEARDTIGDPSALIGTYTEEEQIAQAGKAIETGDADVLKGEFGGLGFDPFEVLLQDNSEKETIVPTATLPSLFPDDYHYASQAFHWLKQNHETLQVELNDTKREFWVSVTRDSESDDLASRFHYLPPEVIPENGPLHLSSSTAEVQVAMEEARKEEAEWPKLQYLWPLHPVVEWLNDRVRATFGRHEAPVTLLKSLRPDEALVLISGLYPNRLGHPIVHRWVGVRFKGKNVQEILDLEATLKLCGLKNEKLVNSKTADIGRIETLKELLPTAIENAKNLLVKEKKDWSAKTTPQLQATEKRLADLLIQHNAQLEIVFSKGLEQVNRGRLETRQEEVKRQFNSHLQWVRDTHHLEEHAHFTVLAVCTGA